MEKKHYPTKAELNKLWWYRLYRVIKWIAIVIALFAPTFRNGYWYFDGIINAVLWYLALLGIWSIIKYIIYGKAPNSEEFKKERKATYHKIIGLIIVVIMYLFIVWSYISVFILALS